MLNAKQHLEQVLTDIHIERSRQDHKWGVQNHGVAAWLLILAEEFGEAAKEANELHFRVGDPTSYRHELVQTAAVCVAAIQALDRGHK